MYTDINRRNLRRLEHCTATSVLGIATSLNFSEGNMVDDAEKTGPARFPETG
jgi:hypothetical protein